MRILLAIFVSAVSQLAQAQIRQQEIAPGSSNTRVTFRLAARLETGDRFVLIAGTDKIHPVFITPDGRRFDQSNAENAGVSWSQEEVTPPIGSADGGYILLIMPPKQAPAGDYTFEFDAREVRTSSQVRLRFISKRQEYLSAFSSLRGFQAPEPVHLDRSHKAADFDFDIGNDDKGSVFDVVTTSPGAKVSLTMPSGRSLDTPNGQADGLEWRTLRKADDTPGSWGELSLFLLPTEGVRHVFKFASVVAGRYRIRVEWSGADNDEAAAIFIPYERALQPQPSPLVAQAGGTPDWLPIHIAHFTVTGLPPFCHVGDLVDFTVQNAGQAADYASMKFKVDVEYRLEQGVDGKRQSVLGEPFLGREKIVLTQTTPGSYRGQMVAAHPGMLRLAVTATGRTADGKAFSEETLPSSMRVDPVIARLESLTQKPVRGPDGKHFDHLEITARLNVVRPGDYEFLAGIGNPGPFTGAFTSENKKLSAGPHIWTISIRAAKLRRGLKDGPAEIRPVRISSSEDGLPRDVDTAKFVLRSVFKSSEWMDASANPSSP